MKLNEEIQDLLSTACRNKHLVYLHQQNKATNLLQLDKFEQTRDVWFGMDKKFH